MKTSGAPGLGHNQGPPLDPAERWRRHRWKVAKRALFRPLPIETVRRLVKRAAELGLAHRRYELLVLGGGEVRAMLIAEDSLVITAPYASPTAKPEQGALSKLAAVTGCRRLLLAGARAGCSRSGPCRRRLAPFSRRRSGFLRNFCWRHHRSRPTGRRSPTGCAAAPCPPVRSRSSATEPMAPPGSPGRGSPGWCPPPSISPPDTPRPAL